MDFGLSKEMSADIIQEKINILSEMSFAMEDYFKNRDYGKGISSLTIGIVCVAPEFEFFFKKIRSKYIKSKKMLEYDVKVEHSVLKEANEPMLQSIVAEAIFTSLGIIDDLKIQDFDIDRFRVDLKGFFKSEGIGLNTD